MNARGCASSKTSSPPELVEPHVEHSHLAGDVSITLLQLVGKCNVCLHPQHAVPPLHEEVKVGPVVDTNVEDCPVRARPQRKAGVFGCTPHAGAGTVPGSWRPCRQ
eukprot:CAMPEP_0114127884 /NCGR_PEP_ID=MMETSP0043_2-20121206/10636_1 /TAXON_ID=464988 /ORGANISM="Hemiselmis andersenii, Strain CCMP644" /LENGTH=105 /DNA_ID=CAMNT_0001221035 /DNA_START=522 /DNA_END=837 /DNA_ORIENTATION=-